MFTHFRRFAVVFALICSTGMAVTAASLDKALADADGRRHRGRDQSRRQKAAADLRERLSWKPFEELQ